MTNTNQLVATFAQNASHQTCTPGSAKDTGRRAQYTVRGPFRFVVATGTYEQFGELNTGGVRFHGAWRDEPEAMRFAWSMGNGKPNSDRGPQVVEVPPYYYCEAWGKVDAELVHAYDEAAQTLGVVPAACPGVVS